MTIYDNINGMPAGFDANTGKQLFITMLPKELIELNIEIATRIRLRFIIYRV